MAAVHIFLIVVGYYITYDITTIVKNGFSIITVDSGGTLIFSFILIGINNFISIISSGADLTTRKIGLGGISI